MPWIARGLRHGVVTSGYPARPDAYPAGWRQQVVVADHRHPAGTPAGTPAAAGQADLARLCPTGAIAVTAGRVTLDSGACICCGCCVRARPEIFAFTDAFETAALSRAALIVGSGPEDDAGLAAVRAALDHRVRALRRSVHIRHVDAGSDGAVEWEVAALTNPVYDVHRLGIFFTASPRHADILLVTGVGTAAMAGPLGATRAAMPDPVVVIAAGTDAISGGLIAPGYASGPGVGRLLDVDVWVPGSPPSPFTLLHAILLALGRLPARRPRHPDTSVERATGAGAP